MGRMKLLSLKLSYIFIATFLFFGCDGGGFKHPAVPSPTREFEDGSRRVIAYGPSIVEFFYAMGLEDQIVGVSPYCDHPSDAKNFPVVGTANEPNVEKILVLQPDLIVALGKAHKLMSIARHRKIEFLSLPAESIQDVLQAPIILAHALGKPRVGISVSEHLRLELEEIRQEYSRLPELDVLLVMGSKNNKVFSAGKGSFLTELVELVGAHSITSDMEQRWPMVSLETVLVRRPEVILVLDGRANLSSEVRARFLLEWEMHTTLPAVRRKRVHVLNGTFLMRSGPRIPLIARLIADSIYPDHLASRKSE